MEQFLSALAWVSNSGLTTHNMQGAGHLYAVPVKGHLGTTFPGRTFDYLPERPSTEARLALASYREGLSVNSVPYQFFGFVKVLNLRFKGGEQERWINDHLDDVREPVAIHRLGVLRTSNRNIGKYLYRDGRCAVAHALGTRRVVNPDDPRDIERLREDLPLMQALARFFIESELGVNTPRKEASERDARLRAEHRTPQPNQAPAKPE
jgi:hypothetical protein